MWESKLVFANSINSFDFLENLEKAQIKDFFETLLNNDRKIMIIYCIITTL